MIKETGTIEFTEADDANIPVFIFLNENEEEDKNIGKYQLTATNYKPRKSELEQDAFRAIGTQEELV